MTNSFWVIKFEVIKGKKLHGSSSNYHIRRFLCKYVIICLHGQDYFIWNGVELSEVKKIIHIFFYYDLYYGVFNTNIKGTSCSSTG